MTTGGNGGGKTKVQRVREALASSPVVPLLLGSVTALAALLATFGGADGARRNHEWFLLIAVAVVGLALLLGGLAAIHDVSYAASAGLVLLVAGLLIAAWAALDHHAGRPQISASLITSAPEHIEATIVRDGLAAHDQMEASVQGYSNKNGSDDNKHALVTTLYRASFGPDESGKAALSFQVPVPRNNRIKSILLRTWVATNKPVNLSCSTAAAAGSSSISSHWAACVLIVLP